MEGKKWRGAVTKLGWEWGRIVRVRGGMIKREKNRNMSFEIRIRNRS